MSKLTNNAHQQVATTSPKVVSGSDLMGSDVQALRELLDQEERKLSVLKTIHGMQGASEGTTATNKSSSIQGSALNKTSGRSSGGSGRNSPNLRAQHKHSIVVVPGQQSSRVQQGQQGQGSSAGISSRLQQLVDNIAVDQALTSASERLQPNASTTGKSSKMVSVTTPPVPGLTSLATTGSQKHNFITSSSEKFFQFSSSNNSPKLKPKIITTTTSITNRPSSSHEIITISDSPIGKKPPPLLSSAPSTRIPTATANGSIQVPTISSSGMHGQATTDKNYAKTAENSRRYREYILKQTHAKKTFQKQMERKMVVAPYPKTFRQVWPLIPVHDINFVRNFGMEAVMHHFDPESKAIQEKSNSKVKPICNQCGCDFASAWQIRKSNSKQLLLCEACDFQNLKILQRSKLSNQLKELLDSIKTEQGKFNTECEEARKQILELEKQATVSPPPLTSQLLTTSIQQRPTSQSTGNRATSQNQVSNRYHVLTTANSKTNAVQSHSGSSSSSQHHTIVIPSVLGQRTQAADSGNKRAVPISTKRLATKVEVGTKRLSPAGQASAPQSKVCRPGSALDETLNRLSKQLIKRKLDEHRQECQQEDEEGVVVVVPDCKLETGVNEPDGAKKDMLTSPTSPIPAGQKAKSRRKGTPKHKRLLSASSE